MQSSTYALMGPAERDGRQYVRETHVDAAGVTHVREYRAPAGWTATEYSARLVASAAAIDADLAAKEAAALIEQD